MLPEPLTLLINDNLITLIFPTYFVYLDRKNVNVWYMGQPRHWDRGQTFDWPRSDPRDENIYVP